MSESLPAPRAPTPGHEGTLKEPGTRRMKATRAATPGEIAVRLRAAMDAMGIRSAKELAEGTAFTASRASRVLKGSQGQPAGVIIAFARRVDLTYEDLAEVELA